MHNLASEFEISLRGGALVVMHDEEWGTIDGICEQFFGFIEKLRNPILYISTQCVILYSYFFFFLFDDV